MPLKPKNIILVVNNDKDHNIIKLFNDLWFNHTYLTAKAHGCNNNTNQLIKIPKMSRTSAKAEEV